MKIIIILKIITKKPNLNYLAKITSKSVANYKL